jgi:O-glycosyl hydrolase
MSKEHKPTPANNPEARLNLSRREVLKGAVLSVTTLAGSVTLPMHAAAQNQTVVQLPAAGPPAGNRGQSFSFDSSTQKVQVWGVHGEVYPRSYFGEFLPALVDRTLVFDDFDLSANGILSWIFTGPRAGFTVQFKPGEVSLTQRYYDSPGLAPLLTHPPASHFAESISDSSTVKFQGRVQSVRVALDSRLRLELFVNGSRLLQQTCVMDVERHQLAYAGASPSVHGAMLDPEVETATVEVHPDRKHQTMLGFGGTTTPPAYVLLSPEGKRRWWELLCEYNLLLHRDYPMGKHLDAEMDNWASGADASPHYYGDNFPNCEVSDFHYIEAIRKVGGRVMFEFWQLPAWARQSEWKDSSGSVHHDVANPEQYTRAVMDYCQSSKQHAGSPPDYIGIQNELGQPPEIWNQMTLSLREALDYAGFKKIKLYMPDRPFISRGIQTAKAFRQFPGAWKAIDFSAVHMYDFQQHFTDPDGYDASLTEWHEATEGRPFLSTELCVNDTKYQEQSYRVALVMGQLYHKNLTLAAASAICYCWTLLNVQQPSFGWTRSLFVPDPSAGFVPKASSCQLRVYGSFSRRVQEGMVRLEAESSNLDLMVTAYAGSNGARTLIALNRSLKTQRMTITWPAANFRFAELTDPYRQNVLVENPVPQNGNLDIIVQPGSIVTLSTVPLKTLPPDFIVPA